MGKRELVLVVLFAVLGMVVYRITAPPPPPGSEGASLSSVWRALQRQVHGDHATAAADFVDSVPADGVRELRVAIPRAGTISVTGEDRRDISATIHVSARGFDDPEARASLNRVHLKLERLGDGVVARTEVSAAPRPSVPSPQLTVSLRVPRGLAVRVEPNSGPLTVTGVASADVANARGETHVTAVAGAVTITQSVGALTIDGCGELKLTARAATATVRNVSGTATVDATAGRLTIDNVIGPLEINARGARLTLTGLTRLAAPLRVTATSGTLDVEGLRTETRIDAHSVRLDLSLAAAAPVTVYSTGDDIAITPPAAGYTLDAVATNGRVAVEDAPLETSTSDEDQRANGSVRGGGAALVLRATHGDIRVRPHASGK